MNIAQMERMIDAGESIEILPDGSVLAGQEVTPSERDFKPLTFREELGGNY